MKERVPNLPSVLENYDPEYAHHHHQLNKNTQQTSDSARIEAAGYGQRSKRVETRGTPTKPSNSSPTVASGQSHPASKSARKHGQTEDERLEHVAALWDQVKLEYAQEEHERLEEKIELQHQLIKAQDRRARERKRQEEHDAQRKRSEERQAKKDRANALQEKGKQSSGSESSVRSRKSSQKDESQPPSEPRSSPTTTDSSGQRRQHQHHAGYLPSDAYAPATSPMKELLQEEEEEEEEDLKVPRAPDGVVTPKDLSEVPWHHAQLYKMYGRHADYYIHPKMQPEKKKIVNPTLKSQKVRKMGHLGASHIWTTLRKDSMNKLHKTDRRFPPELKSAFSAHVREGITNHKVPVFRNFTVTEDVPDLNRLMDQSLLRRIRVLRHKTELMYRSSQTNHDRTKVLLFNSPMQTVSDGDEGIDRYLPSWEDTEEEADTPLPYTKWIKKAASVDGDNTDRTTTEFDTSAGKTHRPHPPSVLSPLGSEFSDSLHSVWDSIMARQKPRQPPKYHFLTEAEARSKGTFLENLGLDKEKLDLGRIDLLPEYQQQQQLSGRSSSQGIKALSAPHSRASLSGPLPPVDQSAYQTRWQPLSLNALIEYKDQMASHGAGEFHQGRPTMWKAGLATASVD